MSADGSGLARPRLLFVDDETRILVSLRAIFRNDYDVTIAEGGQAALEKLKESTFDVIVSDQRMPDITGVEVLRSAREIQPQAIRILLTGYSDLNAIIASINEGEIFRFISKPWSNTELRETIATAVKAAKVEQIESLPSAPLPQAQPVATDIGVLVLDDDPVTAGTVREALGPKREVFAASRVDDVPALLGQHRIGVLFTEIRVDGQSVIPLLAVLRQHHPALVVIVFTARPDAEHGISLINHGQVFRLLLKPGTGSILRGTVNIGSRRFEHLEREPSQSQRLVADTAQLVSVAERSGLLGKMRQFLRKWV
ncbi:MAG TPA: response regulator [Nevskiaceae bacterium]|nr:response regulator [Nevskiaceae bacterium]